MSYIQAFTQLLAVTSPNAIASGQISAPAANQMALSTNSGNTMVQRMLFQGAAIQGAAPIRLFENIQLPSISSGLPSSALNYIAVDASGNVFLNGGVTGVLELQQSGSNVMAVAGAGMGIFTTVYNYNGTSTAGMGVVPVYAAYANGANTTAQSMASLAPPALGQYRVHGLLVLTAAVTAAIQVQITWKSAEGTGQTAIVPLYLGTAGTTVATAVAAGNYSFSFDIYANTGTNIATATIGTFTSVTYDAADVIERVQ